MLGAEEAELETDEAGAGSPLAVLVVAVVALGLVLLPAAIGVAIILGRTVTLDPWAGTWFTPLAALQVLGLAWALVAGVALAPRLVRTTAAGVV